MNIIYQFYYVGNPEIKQKISRRLKSLKIIRSVHHIKKNIVQ